MRYYVPSAQDQEEGGVFHQVYDTGMMTLPSQPGRAQIKSPRLETNGLFL